LDSPRHTPSGYSGPATVPVKDSAAHIQKLEAECRRLKAALQTQEIKHVALINSMGEGLIILDPKGRISQVNAYATTALGFTKEELIGKWFPGVIVLVDQAGRELDPLRRPIIEALTEGKPISEYTNILCKDGTSIPVLITASPIIIDGKPAGSIEVFRDLTKERQLDLAKDDFVSIASHQLRTPATGVKAILSMLAGENFGSLNDKQAHYLEMANRSNDRQLRIIEDLLSVARADAGTMDLSLDYVDLVSLVREVAHEHQTDLVKHRQTLALSVPPSAHVLADGPKLQMVIDNLIGNACKYTPSGGSIKVSVTQADTHVTLTVSDTGVGIEPDDIETIFMKFGRVDNVMSTPGGSTGLGLYLAKKIIELHNGDITVESVTGEGSSFHIVIPTTHTG
jgi:PAS domain S-box-containing protein